MSAFAVWKSSLLIPFSPHVLIQNSHRKSSFACFWRLTFSQFSNLCGTVYKQGNLIFTPDGNSLLSPVGNRVSVFDLVSFVFS